VDYRSKRSTTTTTTTTSSSGKEENDLYGNPSSAVPWEPFMECGATLSSIAPAASDGGSAAFTISRGAAWGEPPPATIPPSLPGVEGKDNGANLISCIDSELIGEERSWSIDGFEAGRTITTSTTTTTTTTITTTTTTVATTTTETTNAKGRGGGRDLPAMIIALNP